MQDTRRHRRAIQRWGIQIAVVAGLVAIPHGASAQPPQNERLLYHVMFGGLHIGNLLVGLKQNETGYATEMKMTARGALRWMREFRADLRGEGALVRDQGQVDLMPRPANFQRAWSAGEIAGDLTMTFDPLTQTAFTTERLFNPVTGQDMRREDMPWNNRRAKLKPVPEEMRTNVFDPMAAFVAARQQLLAQGGAVAAGTAYRVQIYDGVRRYDIVGKTGLVRTVEINGTTRPLMPVTARIEPVFGFANESEDRARQAEGKLYFSPDERFIPVQVVAGNDMLTGVLNLAADCRENTQACLEFSDDKVDVTN